MARRYPNRRPSDYLGIDDDWTAFQVDMALAIRGENDDRMFLSKAVEAIRSDLVMVMKALGAKVKISKPSDVVKSVVNKDPKELPHIREVLSALGGRGTYVSYKKKKEGDKK